MIAGVLSRVWTRFGLMTSFRRATKDLNNLTKKPDNPAYLGRIAYIRIYKKPELGDALRGRIDNITFRNIRYIGNHNPASYIEGFDESHDVSDILFENLYIRDKHVTDAKTGNFIIQDFVKNVRFK